MKRTVWVSSSVVLVLSCPLAMANNHDTFGVGAASIGAGNAQTASAQGGAAAYFNPAALANTKGIRLEAGFQAFVPNFPSYQDIVYDRNQNGTIEVAPDGTPEHTTVTNDYATTAGLAINTSLPVNRFIALGASIYMPAQYLMRMQFEDPYLPYYPMYKNRTQRFTAYAGVGVKVFDGLFLGAGAAVSANAVVQGRVSSHLAVVAGQTDENGNSLPSSVVATVNVDDISIGLKSAVSPTFGALLNFGWIAPPLAGLNLGITYRGSTSVKAAADLTVNTYGDVQLADDKIYSGPLTSEPIHVVIDNLTSGMSPAELAAGLSYTLADKVTVSADATFTQWTEFRDDIIAIPNTTVDVQGLAVITIQGAREIEGDPGLLWHNTLTPRLGVEYTGAMPRGKELGFKYTVRAGYGYQPTPVPDQVKNTNFMDADKHMLSGGLGFQIPIAYLTNPLRVDTFVSLHKLVPRTMTKGENVGPDSNGEYQPGYPLGGSITAEGSLLGFGGSVGFTF